MKNMVSHFYSEKLILAGILLNTFVIYLHSFDSLSAYFPLFIWTDHAFTIYFICELLVKILFTPEGEFRNLSNGLKEYFKDSWHYVDFIAISCSVPSLILAFSTQGAFIEFFVVFRALRIFKLVRVIEFIPNANEIARSVFKALRSVSFILISFLIYTTIVSLINVSLFKHNAPKYFSNGFESFFSTFIIFSGDGFFDVTTTIVNHASPMKGFFTKIYFAAVILFGSILGLSLINSIFIDEMNRESRSTLEKGLKDIGKMHDTVISLEEKILDLEKKNNELLKEIRNKQNI